MKKIIIGGIAGLLVITVFSVIVFAVEQPIQVLPRIQLAPGFSLTDQYGQKLTSEDLRGQFVLYNFTYTNCPPPCGQLDTTMREIQNRLNEVELNGVSVALVTISFDPERDTPKVLNQYALSVGANPAVWRFATMENTTLLKEVIGNSFEVYYSPNEDGSYSFDPSFVLVDGWGIIRGQYRYRSLSPEADRILRHLGVLAEEAEKSVGVNRYAYEAAHLFLCYVP